MSAPYIAKTNFHFVHAIGFHKFAQLPCLYAEKGLFKSIKMLGWDITLF